MIVDFEKEAPVETIGSKAHNLSRMWRAGLPVPPGFCVTSDSSESVDVDDAELTRALARLHTDAFAVRSSALLEDTARTSFAGILLSRLNVSTPDAVLSVIIDIHNSSLAPAARNYAGRHDIRSSVRVAAIVQRFIPAETSGVLFMRDPLTGKRNIIVEAGWGLGSGVAEGLVRPDRWIMSDDGIITSAQIADKDIAVVAAANGGTTEIPVDPACRRRPCLSDESLQQLAMLARECERLFGGPQDIEWAVAGDRVWLLQSRPITT